MKTLLAALAAGLVLTLTACGHGHEHSTDGTHATVEPEGADGTAAAEVPDGTEASAAEWTDLLPNAKRPLAGVVSGGQPSEEQLARAAAAGYRTVINLRMPSEDGVADEEARVAELGMQYVSLPIDGADGITEENARALAESLETSERPVLLHCGSGNRIGALLALSSYYVEGKSADEAIQYGLDSGLTGLEPVVRERLAAAGGD